jgi:hypothetical protein
MVTGDRTRIGKRLLVARIEAGIESADMMGLLQALVAYVVPNADDLAGSALVLR